MIINWGDAPFKAFITVTYPSGTCTVTGEGQSYTHTGGGTTTFTVKKKGSYAVNSTATNATAGSSVSIAEAGQTANVTLKYELILFNGGQTVPWIANGSYNSAGSSIHVTANANEACCVSTSSKIDLTHYKTLYITVARAYCRGTHSWNYIRAGVSDNSSAGSTGGSAGNFTKYVQICGPGGSFSSAKTFSLDISAYGAKHVKIATEANNYGVTSSFDSDGTITKVWVTS